MRNNICLHEGWSGSAKLGYVCGSYGLRPKCLELAKIRLTEFWEILLLLFTQWGMELIHFINYNIFSLSREKPNGVYNEYFSKHQLLYAVPPCHPDSYLVLPSVRPSLLNSFNIYSLHLHRIKSKPLKLSVLREEIRWFIAQH